MKLDVRTVLILTHPEDKNKILLLRRSPNKKLFPNLITGIGGKVELEAGEGQDLEKSLLREFTEETKIPVQLITNVKQRLSLIINRGQEVVVLLWYTGKLLHIPEDLSCTEGTLEFFNLNILPTEEMIPTAQKSIPFICSLTDSDNTIYSGLFDEHETLTVRPMT